MFKRLTLSLISLGALSFGQAEEHTWPIFRGLGGSGQALGQAIPTKFGSDKNLAWKTSLPSGHSSPIVWGNKLFVTGHVGTKVKMLCHDRRTGKLIWERMRSIPKIPEFYHIAGSVAAATPATDGNRGVIYFDDYCLSPPIWMETCFGNIASLQPPATNSATVPLPSSRKKNFY